MHQQQRPELGSRCHLNMNVIANNLMPETAMVMKCAVSTPAICTLAQVHLLGMTATQRTLIQSPRPVLRT